MSEQDIQRLSHDYEVLRLALQRECERSQRGADLAVWARELSGLTRYHAMHAEVSPGDRARIAHLCDLIEGREGPGFPHG